MRAARLLIHPAVLLVTVGCCVYLGNAAYIAYGPNLGTLLICGFSVAAMARKAKRLALFLIRSEGPRR